MRPKYMKELHDDLAKSRKLAREYIGKNCRPLYGELFDYHFYEGDQNRVLKELKTYQNRDGGFGHGLEPDFLLPSSSPMATTVAFQILKNLGIKSDSMELIEPALSYLEKTFVSERSGWFSVPSEVNDYPHAPWWHYDFKAGGTPIDQSWGNPTAEFFGILSAYGDRVKQVPLDSLGEKCIQRLESIKEFNSYHEIFCYLRMYPYVSRARQNGLKPHLERAVKNLMCLDESQWAAYVPKPLDFIKSSDHPLFYLVADYSQSHVDYLKSTMIQGIWKPNWFWAQYEENWPASEKNWAGYITVKNHLILREFSS